MQAVRTSSRTKWVELVRRVDDAGFDMIVTADHLGDSLSPLLPLAVAAQVSDRLRLGVMVLNNDFTHPSLLARSAATLDLLSDGRLELGLGAGHARPEYERAGLVFDSARVRVDRLEEAVPLIRQLLDGDTVTHTGTHYQLVEERCEVRPVQAKMPLLVGGSGRRVHAIAARFADAVGFTGLGKTLDDGQHHDASGFTAQSVDDDVAALTQAVAAANRSWPLEMQVLVQGVVVTDNAISAAENICRTALPMLTPGDVLSSPYLMVGTVATIVDRLIEQRERWGFSHYTVRRDALGQLEPVIASLAGR